MSFDGNEELCCEECGICILDDGSVRERDNGDVLCDPCDEALNENDFDDSWESWDDEEDFEDEEW